MWCARLDRDRKETSQMKTITKKASKAPKATTKTSDPILTGAEPELGNPQGITINDSTEVIKPTEEARQDQMKTDLTKLKAGDKKRKAAVKAAKKATAEPVAKAAKTAKPATTKKAPKPAGSGPRETSKTAQLIEMLKRPKGATLEEVMAKFGWQVHTARALMSAGGSLTKKHGLTVISEKVGDSRTYRIAK
jgi:biopolymer transport protein ExbD